MISSKDTWPTINSKNLWKNIYTKIYPPENGHLWSLTKSIKQSDPKNKSNSNDM